jgi:hypothetical protein
MASHCCEGKAGSGFEECGEEMKPLPCAGAVLCSLLCLINALNGQPVLAVFCAVIAAWWVYLATASFASPNFKKGGKK